MTSWLFDQFHVLHCPFFITCDQFYMTSDQFEKGDDQNWSQKPQDPKSSIFYFFINRSAFSIKNSHFLDKNSKAKSRQILKA